SRKHEGIAVRAFLPDCKLTPIDDTRLMKFVPGGKPILIVYPHPYFNRVIVEPDCIRGCGDKPSGGRHCKVKVAPQILECGVQPWRRVDLLYARVGLDASCARLS